MLEMIFGFCLMLINLQKLQKLKIHGLHMLYIS